MARPCKQRRIRGNPHSSNFKPSGIRRRDLEEVHISSEAFEAIRLKDYVGYDQSRCAHEMGVSQPTFHRLLHHARHVIADALINGKAFTIGETEINEPSSKLSDSSDNNDEKIQ